MIYLKKSQNRQIKFNTAQEGSITIFLALVLTLILSFLFSMIELARVNGLQELSKRKLQLELESAFGAYNQELWEHYGLLFLDMSYGSGEQDIRNLEGHMMEEAYAEREEAHFYQMALKDMEVESYALATDGGGAAFQKQACEVAKENMAKKGIETLKDQFTEWQGIEEKSGDVEQGWEDALAAEEEAENYKEEAETGNNTGKTEGGDDTGIEVSKESLPENPMDYVKEWKASSLLTLVLEEPSELSQKGIDVSTGLENRELFCGNMTSEKGSTVDKLWFIQYLNEYFSCKTKGKGDGHALDYELEYCIAGKGTDAENLEAVVKKLLLLREGANFVTIMQDEGKKSLAMEIAVAAVGFTGIMPLITAVQKGILLAWCYVESIMDVRCLLSGGSVPLMKNTSQWKSDLFHISEEVSQGTATESIDGLDYSEYLQILLCATGENQLTYRAMNIVEQNIRLFSGNTSLRMDAMVSEVVVNASYQAESLFFNLIPIRKKINGSYWFRETQRFSYEGN